MSLVAEIGCGNSPGPFFEEADTHFAIENGSRALQSLRLGENAFTVVEADARDLKFPDNSIDIVLARNVFGDPMLGMTELEKTMHSGLRWEAIMTDDFSEFRAVDKAVQGFINDGKLAILGEAARILIKGGKLLIIEQYTPPIADIFLARARQEGVLPDGLVIQKADLADIASPSYTKRHLPAEAWLGIVVQA